MRKIVVLKITYDTWNASKQGVINIISRLKFVDEVEEVEKEK